MMTFEQWVGSFIDVGRLAEKFEKDLRKKTWTVLQKMGRWSPIDYCNTFSEAKRPNESNTPLCREV